MAREYAKVKVTIWADTDFRSLSPAAQHLYFLLLTSPTLNMAGVCDWRPSRLAKMAQGWTPKKVRDAAAELEAARFALFDDDTEEALCRSFVRHDGVLKSPNLTTAMVKDYAGIGSPKLLSALANEVHRAAEDNPEWKGLDSASEILSKPIPKGSETVPEEFAEGSPIPHTSNNIPAPPSAPDGAGLFDEFWNLYPRKRDKGHGRKAWAKALKVASGQEIIDGLKRQVQSWADAGTQEEFIPYPATWLNGERWTDDHGLPQLRAVGFAAPHVSELRYHDED